MNVKDVNDKKLYKRKAKQASGGAVQRCGEAAEQQRDDYIGYQRDVYMNL